jgi:hypothetical protein
MSADYRLTGSVELLWHKWTAQVMGAMFEHGSSTGEVEAVMASIKPLFVHAYEPAVFTGSLEDRETAVRAWHFDKLNKLLLEIIGREIELPRHRAH